MDLESLKSIGINTEDGLAYCAEDEEFYGEMIEEYIAEKDGRAKELAESFDQGDWDRYRIAAHSVKSTSRMIGADELSETAREMEQAAKDNNEEMLLTEHALFLSEYIKLAEKLSAVLAADQE